MSDGVGQRRVGVVVLGVLPPPRKVLFAKRRAITDLDRDSAPTRIEFCPERIGFVEMDRVWGLIMRR